jgi:hypothetical protein
MTHSKFVRSRGAVRVRIFSLTALAMFVGGIAYVGHLGYRAGTDSFVAPIILSPDSDIVLNSKLQASQVQVPAIIPGLHVEGPAKHAWRRAAAA